MEEKRSRTRTSTRPASRASLTHVRVYANAPHGAMGRRPTEYTGYREDGIRTRGTAREQESGRGTDEGGPGAGGRSDAGK